MSFVLLPARKSQPGGLLLGSRNVARDEGVACCLTRDAGVCYNPVAQRARRVYQERGRLMAEVGLRKEDLDTPVLWVDLDALEGHSAPEIHNIGDSFEPATIAQAAKAGYGLAHAL